MSAEHVHSEIQRFYIQERLPQLQELIEAFWDGTNMLPRESIEGIVAEFNQGLSLVHIQKAPHMPHYRVVSNGKGDLSIEQYIPALQKEVPRKQPRNEIQLITPTVTKIADSEHPYPFSLDFLTPHLDDLADAIQQETIEAEVEYETDSLEEAEEKPFEIVIYSGGSNDGQEDDSTEPGMISESFYVAYDEDIAPGMMLLELRAPNSEKIDCLMLPHIHLNFEMIMSLIEDYLLVGGEALVTFSLQDKNNNLLTPPEDPRNPDEPSDPRLN